MRALCASIITTGALIGLGLSAVGVGMRYQNQTMVGRDASAITYVKWVQLDTPMMLIIVTLLTALLGGLAATFLGLSYHHERRHYERHGHSKPAESRL
jgi:hypothetical protein